MVHVRNAEAGSKSQTPWQFSIHTLMLLILSCAVLLAVVLMPPGQLGRVFFGGKYLTKTEFTARDVALVERAMGVATTPRTEVEIATFGGSRDHSLTVRLRVPIEESRRLEQAIRDGATESNVVFLGELQSAASEWSRCKMDIAAAFQVGSARQFIICKPDGDTVTIYFEAYAELDQDVVGIAQSLFSKQ